MKSWRSAHRVPSTVQNTTPVNAGVADFQYVTEFMVDLLIRFTKENHDD